MNTAINPKLPSAVQQAVDELNLRNAVQEPDGKRFKLSQHKGGADIWAIENMRPGVGFERGPKYSLDDPVFGFVDSDDNIATAGTE
ncbi:MAG TPA: hypothetical protein V6C96_01690 [Vampirovibrionales bacterium]